MALSDDNGRRHPARGVLEETLAKLRTDEQEHYMKHRSEASWHKTTKLRDVRITVNDTAVQGKFMFLSGEIC